MAADNLARVDDEIAKTADDGVGNGVDVAKGPAGDRRAPDSPMRGAAAPGTPSATSLGAVRDIAVTMSMEIGRTRLTIAELMRLGEGSVVELERMADEPLDVFVNGTLVARGEAVVVGERFGLRLTEVVGGGGLEPS